LHPLADEALLKAMWARMLPLDPFYSPHLTHAGESWDIRR